MCFFINVIPVFIHVRILWRSVTELIILRENHLQDEYKHSSLILYKRIALNSFLFSFLLWHYYYFCFSKKKNTIVLGVSQLFCSC